MQPNNSDERPVNSVDNNHQPEVITPVMTPQVSPPTWQSEPATAAPTEEVQYTGADVQSPVSLAPQPVVNVLSPRGVEYVFMTISLFTAAIGLAGVLIAAVNGSLNFTSLSFPIALLTVGLPLFAWLFLHLKKTELLEPGAALDASKRRSTQTTQIICFLVVLFSMIGFISAVMAKIGGHLGESILKVILDVVVLLVVFGGILFYYWRDEHKA